MKVIMLAIAMLVLIGNRDSVASASVRSLAQEVDVITYEEKRRETDALETRTVTVIVQLGRESLTIHHVTWITGSRQSQAVNSRTKDVFLQASGTVDALFDRMAALSQQLEDDGNLTGVSAGEGMLTIMHNVGGYWIRGWRRPLPLEDEGSKEMIAAFFEVVDDYKKNAYQIERESKNLLAEGDTVAPVDLDWDMVAANPQAYLGKRVRINGFLTLGREVRSVRRSANAIQEGDGIGIELGATSTFSKVDILERPSFRGRVTIVGTMLSESHLGRITDIVPIRE